MAVNPATGLTAAEIQARRSQGEGNAVKLQSSRSVGDILKTNVFSPVNVVLYAIGAGMILVGDWRSAVTTVMLVLFNAVVGIVQEVAAKRKLDKIALLARTTVTVRRDGQDRQVDPADLVLGDILVITAGDQMPVDGVIVDSGKLEMDESALTGESDAVDKAPGDQVLSGSFCITGKALVQATKVGEQSFANQLTKNARQFKLEQTPLQQDVNRLLRILLLVVVFYGILLVLALWVLDLRVDLWLQALAVITGSISAGLLVFITLNYSWGAVRIGQQGGLVQQINAVESLSNVTVLCTDKTGTLTANKIRYHDALPVGIDKAALEQRLANFAASATSTNKTTEAVVEWRQGQKCKIVDEVPFASALKWSALAFDDAANGMRGVYVLGALEMLQGRLTIDDAARQQVQAWSDAGLRVLVFAGAPDSMTLHDAQGEPALPALSLQGIISFSDELRPHLHETLEAFAKNGVKIKVISGDNPQTVSALAKQAGLPGDLTAVSGPELATMSQAEFASHAAQDTVFGRITPQQKEALVDALRGQGAYVAMIGDGVNDVLSLKKADIGIAMESGSTATRAVAGIVLLGDSFEALPKAVTEGQRIVASIQNILKTYMVTVFALLLLITAIGVLQMGFPFTTAQNTMMSFFARGAPPAILSLTAVAAINRTRLSANILHFTLPAAFLLFFLGLLLYTGAFFVTQRGLATIEMTPEMVGVIERTARVAPGSLSGEELYNTAVRYSAQTALVTFFVLTGILLMVFADPPVRWFAGGSPFQHGQWLSAAGAVALIAGYYVVLLVPGLREFFELVPLPPLFHAAILVSTVLWLFLQRYAWRANLLERFLDIPHGDNISAAKTDGSV
ncbi:MAG: HAD-IC family P-type ATPase [Caldilineaceae bacterium]|nr:HAD-IC family P-type ATPase [Caldilineaceae bacterium]